MVTCAIVSCNNNPRNTTGKGISYYSFPKDERVAAEWIRLCKREDKINVKTARICSIHFGSSCMSIRKQILKDFPVHSRLLKPDAIPTENLPLPNFEESPRFESQKRRHQKCKFDDIIAESESNRVVYPLKSAYLNVEDQILPHDDISSDSISVEKESNISSSSNVASLLLECETASSKIIPIPQKSYLAVNADIVTLLLECESEPYVS